MPAFETMDRYQKAVIWRKARTDSFGIVTVYEPVEILVRWKDTNTEQTEANAQTITFDATVVLAQAEEPGSLMWLGELADLPTPPTNVKRIQVCNVTPDLKRRHTRWTARLVKHMDAITTIAVGTGT